MTTNPAHLPFVASVGVFFAILLLMTGIFAYSRYRKRKKSLIEKIQRGGWSSSSSREGLRPDPDLAGRTRSGFLNMFGLLGRRIKPETRSQLPDLRLDFLKAGFRSPNAPAIFWGIKCFFALVLPASFLMLKMMAFKVMDSSLALMIGCFLALIGFYLPNIWLRLKIANRKDNIIKGFPDALDLMVVCVEAGMGLDTAFNRVADEIKLGHPALSEELKLLNLELRAGKARRDALKNLSLRIDQEDVNSLVTLLIQTDKFGTSIANALRVYSDGLRTKRFQKAEVIAAKLPVKLLFPLIFFIFPALFVVIIGPLAIRIYRMFLAP